eukprot:TRINITY_DN446_c0_g2_i1.p1 TRINITY_DN446_c0_g2~~TRINITY_DN446_c0_g2_i1.p1  ORF type:complete len:1646 (+),score=328.09 TRINITY_DN446_c0_g2_i1:46-4983(+)
MSSEDTTVPIEQNGDDSPDNATESEIATAPLLPKNDQGSLGKQQADLEFLRRMRRKLEKKIISGLQGEVLYNKPDSEGDEKVTMTDILENERLYRLQQKYYFVSSQNLTYTVKYTSAKDHQATLWNTLPPVLLWRRFVSKSIQTKTTDILKNVTFYMKPGSMTLLLGAPGSGKTTLFDIIANRIEKPRGVVRGEVKFNGISLPKNLHQRDVGYVTQRDDIHLPRLTVEETLRFAAECQLPGSPPDYIISDRVNYLLGGFGLDHRAGSLVGDNMLRGISGGEKRRLSIAIECTKTPAVMLYDAPTTGLDASAALNFIKALQSFEYQAESCLAALQQPSYEIFCLFENILLLSQGEVAFFGGRKQCLDFFEERGYVCDLTVNPADFLQEVVENPKKYRATKELREQIKQRTQSRKIANGNSEDNENEVDIDKEYTREDFIADWNQNYKPQVIATINAEQKKYLSQEYLDAKANLEQQTASNDDNDDHDNANTEPSLLDRFNPIKIIQKRKRDKLERIEQERIVHYNHEKGYAASFFNELYLNIWRSSLMLFRNQDMFTGRLIIATVIGLILGSLFFKLSFDQRAVQTRGGLLFFLMSYAAFTSLSFLPLFSAEKRIFYFQKSAHYFRIIPYHIGSTIVEIPITLAEVTLLGSITYWMTGLNSDPSRFFFYLFLLFVMSHLFSNAFKLIGIIFSSLDTATTLATSGMCVLFLMSGFTIPVDSIRPYFVWLYWISPFHYAWEGLMINELQGQEFYCKEDQLVPSSSIANFTVPYPDGWSSSQVCPYENGVDFLRTFGFWGDSALNMRWADIGVLGGMAVLTHIGIILGYAFIEPSKPRPRIVEEQETEPQDIELSPLDAQQKEETRDVEEEEEEGSNSQAARFIFKNVCYSVKQKSISIPRPQNVIKKLIKRKKDVDERYVESKNQVQKPGRLQLLTDISGEVLPGQLLALMGASGAGKSTLLDVLARRKTSGKISGDILINGKKMNKYSNRIIGYVEQQDIHIETSTVKEALEFSAACRLPKNRTRQQKKELVSSILNLLELEIIQHRTIATLSQEQKKRVTIGVEMAADPVLLFLDEPTSGLDSRGAEIVMKTIRKIVDSGRVSVICTIHQPSAPVFELFTHLLLVKKGGRMIYFGEIHDSINNVKFGTLFNYFKDVGLYCPPHRNPADWMLDITSHKSDDNDNKNNQGVEKKKMEGIKKWMGKYKQKQKAKTREKRRKLEEELRAKWAKMQQEQNPSQNREDTNNISQRGTEEIDSSSDSSKGKGPATEDSSNSLSDDENSSDTDEEEAYNLLRADEVDPNSLDFVSIFTSSNLHSSMIQSIDSHTTQDKDRYKTERKQLSKKQKRLERKRYASSFHTQLFYSYLRSLLSTWRDPFGVRQRILTSIFLGLLFGLLFLDLSNGVVDTTLKVSLIYFSLLFTALIALSSLPKIINERAVFYRERSSMTYRSIVYLLTLTLSELPFLFLSSVTFCVPVYWLSNLNPEPAKFFIFVLGFTLTNMVSLGFVQVCTVLAPDIGTANTIIGAALSAFDLFAGFIIARNLIPNYWIWMNYASFLAYPIEALSANELRGARIECRASEWVSVPIINSTRGEERLVCPLESGDEVLRSFGLKEERMWIDLGVMAGWWCVFLIITLLALKFVRHIKR